MHILGYTLLFFRESLTPEVLPYSALRIDYCDERPVYINSDLYLRILIVIIRNESYYKEYISTLHIPYVHFASSCSTPIASLNTI